MRSKWGWAVAVLGAVMALLGAAIMVVLGPDSRFSTGPHAIETDGVAVVTAPKVISWAGVRIDVLAEVPARKPIFLGLGNSVDVQSYLDKTRRLEITSFKRPWSIETREVEGTPSLPGAATALDWWIESSAGLGGTSISADLPDQTVSLAVVSVGSSNLTGLTVSVAYGVKGGFAKGLALLLLGAGLAWLGLQWRRDGFWPAETDDPEGADGEVVEEVVYVYVDEDGVEHEISAEEAAGLEAVGLEEVELEEVELEEAVVAEESVPAPVAVAESERVVYVFVDDDGVEHEVGADELDQFEIVDDETDRPDDQEGRR